MNCFTHYVCFAFISLLLGSFTTAEEHCEISEQELNKIQHTLTHINEPIYTEDDESEASDTDECSQMMRGIHYQLRRLTQRYKLMNKGYVKEDEFQKMAEEYEDQLTKLRNELEQMKVVAESGANQKLQELKQSIAALEKNTSSLHKRLEGVNDELGKVTKDLCLTYLESSQLNNAKDKVKSLPSKYLMELVEQFLNNSKGNWLPVVDLSVNIPDLDDRGQVYKTIYEFLQKKSRMEGEDSILLEAEILKMNANLDHRSKITEERKKELQELLGKLSSATNEILRDWASGLNKSEYSAVFKNAIDRMFLTQMEKFEEHVMAKNDYYSMRDFIKLLVVSKNYYKIAAYRKLVENKIGHALATVMMDLISMESTELKHDPHVPNKIERMFNDTIATLPVSLKEILTCVKSIKITNQNSKQCVRATDEKVVVKNPTHNNVLGHFNRVIIASKDCSTFRLEPSSDKASIRIVTEAGNALHNINSAVKDSTWFSNVGAPYVNNHNMKLDSSQDWILDANFDNRSIKIQSEFSVYQMKKTIDHLMVKNVGEVRQVVVARYGLSGMEHSRLNMMDAEWKLECAK